MADTQKHKSKKMISPLSKVKEAITKNEFHALVMGENDYRFVYPWAETPTDIGKVFIQGFNKFVDEGNDNKKILESELHRCLNRLLSTPEGTWWVVSILYTYLFGFVDNALKFQIDIPDLIEPVNASLQKFKNELRGNKNWVGRRFNEGLLDDVSYMIGKINERLKSRRIKELSI